MTTEQFNRKLIKDRIKDLVNKGETIDGLRRGAQFGSDLIDEARAEMEEENAKGEAFLKGFMEG